MKIVADQNIPLVDELFASFGEVVRLPGRGIAHEDIVDADILLVRSVSSVNQALLKNTAVKFVGSCTIGIDHLDTAFMEANDISWAYAPGCNAKAVVQYVLSAMAYCQPQWLDKTIGIIGCGNIGRRLHKLFDALGVKCCAYDPFITHDSELNLVSLTQVLDADIITCHVPLSKSGPYPTWHLLGEEQLNLLKSNSLLINSSRGGVIDEVALMALLKTKSIQVVLDVWEGEPTINTALQEKINLGTPHIAGYSLEGKEQGTFMIYQSLLNFLNRKESDAADMLTCDICPWQYKPLLSSSLNEQLNAILLRCYDIAEDSQALSRWSTSDLGLNDFFDHLRKHYPVRREYSHYDFSALSSDSVLAQKLFALHHLT